MQWSGTPEYRLLCIPQRDICPSSRATCLSNLSCLISNFRRLRSDRFAGVKYWMIIAALSLLAHFDARMAFQLTATQRMLVVASNRASRHLAVCGCGPVIERADHQRCARQRSDECATRVQVKAAADDHEQKHKQAQN